MRRGRGAGRRDADLRRLHHRHRAIRPAHPAADEDTRQGPGDGRGMSALPKIAVIGTGGTISGIGKDRLDLHEYGTSGRFAQVEEVLATVPELDRIAEI